MLVGQKINGKQAQKLTNKGAVLIDTRSPVAFRDGTISGAINVSLRQVSSLVRHKRDTPLIFFGESVEDETLKAMLNYAFQMGFTQVYNLGIKENWEINK